MKNNDFVQIEHVLMPSPCLVWQVNEDDLMKMEVFRAILHPQLCANFEVA